MLPLKKAHLSSSSSSSPQPQPQPRPRPHSHLNSTPGEALLLSQETLGVFVDKTGQPSRPFSIGLSEPPVCVTLSGPFLVSLHRKGADVHAIDRARDAPIHRISQLHGALQICTPSTPPTPPLLLPACVYALSEASLVCIQPPSLLAYAISLAAAGSLDDALGELDP